MPRQHPGRHGQRRSAGLGSVNDSHLEAGFLGLCAAAAAPAAVIGGDDDDDYVSCHHQPICRATDKRLIAEM
jgi:hypothetical protein